MRPPGKARGASISDRHHRPRRRPIQEDRGV